MASLNHVERGKLSSTLIASLIQIYIHKKSSFDAIDLKCSSYFILQYCDDTLNYLVKHCLKNYLVENSRNNS